ncbi:MAG: response regulator [Lachnospiraceae bacterium]|nr:response regulator [Lachnospiraceae bacterium]
MNYEEIINNKFSEPATVFYYKDGQIKTIGVNDRFLPELWMNISGEDFIDADPKRCFDEENLRIFLEGVEKCATTHEEQTVETWRFVFSDCCGFEKICLKSRIVFVDDTPEGAVIYEGVRNISNEKRAQDTLSDIEYRYKHTSEQVNIYNWEYTVATKEMRPCYRCMRDLGLPALVTNYPEPAIDMGIFPPDYADMYRDMMHKIDGGIPEIEADIPLTVGRIPFRVKYTTEFDEKGKPVKAFGSATLISETELGQIKLDNQIITTLAKEYHCIFLLDFVADYVTIIKQDETLCFNEDVRCDDLVKKVASKLEEAAGEQSSLIRDVGLLRSELFRDCEKREFVFKDNNENRWIRIGYHVIERTNDKVARLLITTSVIDELRAQKMDADRLIATQKAQLEDRQEMLLSAIEEANNANKAKTEFFSNMSHDIRTPMNAIMGFSKLAIDEIDNREHLEDYLDKISSAGEHLTNLINDILDMSRIESGKMELSYSPVQMKKLLMGCAEMIHVKMADNKLKFFVNVDKMGDDIVACDKLRFNQVILNLLSNAYKFTPEGGSVYLKGRLLERSDKITYEIRVKDTGIGMSEEFRKEIWEAYSRERNEIVHETQGTGLGMVIVHKIVELMQGTIDVVSEKGKGSEFIIVLPLSPASGEVVEARPEKEEDDVLNKDYTGVTLLVVDDTPLNLKLADRVLSKFGFNVRQSDSAMDAISQLENSKPGEIDLVLMDVLMPVMDGLEATRRIRALDDPELSNIPIIAMTANAFESDVKKAFDAGMDAHIPKPFKKEELVRTISRFLRK